MRQTNSCLDMHNYWSATSYCNWGSWWMDTYRGNHLVIIWDARTTGSIVRRIKLISVINRNIAINGEIMGRIIMTHQGKSMTDDTRRTDLCCRALIVYKMKGYWMAPIQFKIEGPSVVYLKRRKKKSSLYVIIVGRSYRAINVSHMRRSWLIKRRWGVWFSKIWGKSAGMQLIDCWSERI